MEIERKFLVNTVPDCLERFSSAEIEQCYLSFLPEQRIRKKGEKYYFTEKSEGTLVREEQERDISECDYVALKKRHIGNIIYKRRYVIPLEDLAIELDIYKEVLSGLITVEVEFPSEERADSFEIPPWFGKEITADSRYKNKNLAQLKSLADL